MGRCHSRSGGLIQSAWVDGFSQAPAQAAIATAQEQKKMPPPFGGGVSYAVGASVFRFRTLPGGGFFSVFRLGLFLIPERHSGMSSSLVKF